MSYLKRKKFPKLWYVKLILTIFVCNTIRLSSICTAVQVVLRKDLARFYRVARIDLKRNPELSLKAFVSDADVQWHPRRNGDLKPEEVPYNYGGEVWWKCPKGEDHVWKTICRARVDTANKRLERNILHVFLSILACPFCSNNRLSKTNSLSTRYPELSIEFDSLSNGGLLASQIIHTSKKRYFWRCKQNHLYQMSIPQRLQFQSSESFLEE